MDGLDLVHGLVYEMLYLMKRPQTFVDIKDLPSDKEFIAHMDELVA